MGLRERFQDKLMALHAQGRLRLKHEREGKKAPVLTEAQVAAGHPKVSVESDFQGLTYGARLNSMFGWIWLVLVNVIFGFLLFATIKGSARINGRLVVHPTWGDYAQLVGSYVPFLLAGIALTAARYRVTLTDDRVVVRWRVLPYVGWTWSLAVGEQVAVKLAYDGTEVNGDPVPAVVMSSEGEQLSFGSLLKEDVKEYLAGAIQHYYGVPAEPPAFVPPDVPPGPDVRPA
jgi:hypothetical protein